MGLIENLWRNLLRVAIIFYSFPRDMGYSNTMLARYLARMGADVHYVATDLPVYHKSVDARAAYQNFSAEHTMVPGAVEAYDGYTVHCIGHRDVLGTPMFVGLQEKLRQIGPDVVQLYINAGWVPLQTVWAKIRVGFSLFVAAHTTVSVFPLARMNLRVWNKQWIANFVSRVIPGLFASLFTKRCYAATVDCAEVVTGFYGMPKSKVVVVPLGVDTENFYPPRTQSDRDERARLRTQLGFTEAETVCIYTGQFTTAKNPSLLARAVAILRAKGIRIRGLFIGDGPQGVDLAASDGCVVLPFMPHRSLPGFYRAADIGVWPTQESMSMLDAAACGLPIVVNDTLLAKERIEGNGITYRLNDAQDLADKIEVLCNPEFARQLGTAGALRMAESFSWSSIARRRLADYEAAIGKTAQPMQL